MSELEDRPVVEMSDVERDAQIRRYLKLLDTITHTRTLGVIEEHI
jgi:hypothetical protein